MRLNAKKMIFVVLALGTIPSVSFGGPFIALQGYQDIDQSFFSSHVEGILPTWRKVTPVGSVVRTPNFPTKVAVIGTRIAVLANGATPFQTITWYSMGLSRTTRLAAFSKVAPTKVTVLATPGGTGIAINPMHAGPAGVVYTTNQPAKARKQEALEVSISVIG